MATPSTTWAAKSQAVADATANIPADTVARTTALRRTRRRPTASERGPNTNRHGITVKA